VQILTSGIESAGHSLAKLPDEKLSALAEVHPKLHGAVDRIISAYYDPKKLE
jgi:hypothetical protein